MKVRRFNQSDWDGFAGAESFDDESPPFIAGSENFLAIGDRGGVYVILDDDWFYLEIYVKPAVIEAIMKSLPEIITRETLDSYGFKRM